MAQSLYFGPCAYMHSLVHDEVDAQLARWPRAEVEAVQTRGRLHPVWTLAEFVLDALEAG